MLAYKVFRKAEPAEARAHRRDDILSAAERCFVKAGFHRTTIPNIAADADMSVGNLYRYFTSKDAIVEALVGRDQARMARDFDALSAVDLMGGFAALMRGQIIERGRDHAILWLEISAEATRNPSIAAVTHAHETLITANLMKFFARVIAERRASGLPSAEEPGAIVQLVIMLFCGFMVTHARSSATRSLETRIDDMLSVVAAAIEGRHNHRTAADADLGASL